MNQLSYQMAIARQGDLLRQASERRRIDDTASRSAAAASMTWLKPVLRRFQFGLRVRRALAVLTTTPGTHR